jgi:hypothetical protein
MIQPAPYLLKNSGIIEKYGFEFQSSIDSTSYRLILHVSSTSASAYTVKMDNFFVGPAAKLYGSAVTDWVSYAPTFTGFGTVSTSSFHYKRVGDSLYINGTFTAGTPTASAASLTIPSGLVTDSYVGILTTGAYIKTAAAIVHGAPLIVTSNTSTLLFPDPAVYGSGSVSPTTGVNGTNIVGTGEIVKVSAGPIKIQGWSSSQIMSSDADTRVVAYSAQGATTSLPNATVTTVNFTSQVDTHSGWNGTNTYTVKVPGLYRISPSVSFINAANAQYYTDIRINKNGTSAASYTFYYTRSTTAETITLAFDKTLLLVAGDTISIAVYQASGVTGSVTTGSSTNLSIERISGPSQIAASETVAIAYTTSAGQSISNGVATTILYGTKEYDTHSSYNTGTGIFTAPTSGKYSIKAKASLESSCTAGGSFTVFIQKNGSNYSRQTLTTTATLGGTSSYQITITDDIQLLAGETVQIVFVQNEGSAKSMTASAVYNKLQISRIGNY